MDKRSLHKHSKLSKTLGIQAFESLGAFKMYYSIGASVSSLHRESTDSLISSGNIHNLRKYYIAGKICIQKKETTK